MLASSLLIFIFFYILKRAIRIWKLYYFAVNLQAFLWDIFQQQQKALTSGDIMGGAYKALTHKEKSLWRLPSVQILQILLSLTSARLNSTPTFPLSSHPNAEDHFCKFWSGSIWITTNLLSAFRWNTKHLPVRDYQNMCYGNVKLIN